MKKHAERIYLALIFILLYAPIATLIVLSFALLCLRPVLDKRDEKQEKEGTHG